jgi:hypothetical protein
MSDSRFAGAEFDQGWLEARFARMFYVRDALVTPFLKQRCASLIHSALASGAVSIVNI